MFVCVDVSASLAMHTEYSKRIAAAADGTVAVAAAVAAAAAVVLLVVDVDYVEVEASALSTMDDMLHLGTLHRKDYDSTPFRFAKVWEGLPELIEEVRKSFLSLVLDLISFT